MHVSSHRSNTQWETIISWDIDRHAPCIISEQNRAEENLQKKHPQNRFILDSTPSQVRTWQPMVAHGQSAPTRYTLRYLEIPVCERWVLLVKEADGVANVGEALHYRYDGPWLATGELKLLFEVATCVKATKRTGLSTSKRCEVR